MCVTFLINYLATWAATHHLQRIYLSFWRGNAVMQGAYDPFSRLKIVPHINMQHLTTIKCSLVRSGQYGQHSSCVKLFACFLILLSICTAWNQSLPGGLLFSTQPDAGDCFCRQTCAALWSKKLRWVTTFWDQSSSSCCICVCAACVCCSNIVITCNCILLF